MGYTVSAGGRAYSVKEHSERKNTHYDATVLQNLIFVHVRDPEYFLCSLKGTFVLECNPTERRLRNVFSES